MSLILFFYRVEETQPPNMTLFRIYISLNKVYISNCYFIGMDIYNYVVFYCLFHREWLTGNFFYVIKNRCPMMSLIELAIRISIQSMPHWSRISIIHLLLPSHLCQAIYVTPNLTLLPSPFNKIYDKIHLHFFFKICLPHFCTSSSTFKFILALPELNVHLCLRSSISSVPWWCTLSDISFTHCL